MDVEAAKEAMGRAPASEIGSCFDSTGHALLARRGQLKLDARICHAIGVANAPGEEGLTIGHAWIEFDTPFGRVAYDSTWDVLLSADRYREQLTFSYIREYNEYEFVRLWREYDYPGPWDHKIIAAVREDP